MPNLAVTKSNVISQEEAIKENASPRLKASWEKVKAYVTNNFEKQCAVNGGEIPNPLRLKIPKLPKGVQTWTPAEIQSLTKAGAIWLDEFKAGKTQPKQANKASDIENWLSEALRTPDVHKDAEVADSKPADRTDDHKPVDASAKTLEIPKAPPQKEKPAKPTTGDTSSAAEKILERYLRRPRS